jgi:hypothetical protein
LLEINAKFKKPNATCLLSHLFSEEEMRVQWSQVNTARKLL